jgi:hypothetical protein
VFDFLSCSKKKCKPLSSFCPANTLDSRWTENHLIVCRVKLLTIDSRKSSLNGPTREERTGECTKICRFIRNIALQLPGCFANTCKSSVRTQNSLILFNLSKITETPMQNALQKWQLQEAVGSCCGESQAVKNICKQRSGKLLHWRWQTAYVCYSSVGNLTFYRPGVGALLKFKIIFGHGCSGNQISQKQGFPQD